MLPSAGEFFKNYGLTPEKLALAKPDAIVMHPGPINRGVEIDSAVADGAQSVILPQVTFGIAVRMAVMSHHRGERTHEDPHSKRPPDRPGHRAATKSATWPSPPAASSRIGERQRRLPRRTARIDASGLVVAPGLVDLAARLREPGHEHEGMLESEMAAAVAGGVTSLVCPPDTDPALDEPGLVEMLKFRARNLNLRAPVPAGRADARPEGRGADRDGRAHRGRLRRLLAGRGGAAATRWCCTARCSTPRPSATRVWLRPQGRAGWATAWPPSGALATRLGLSGVPVIAETIALHTIFELVRDTGARVHLCRLSAAPPASSWCARAKAEGLPVTLRREHQPRCT